MKRLAAVIAALIMLTAAASAQASVPVNTAPPTYSGTLQQGSTLTTTDGTWTSTPTALIPPMKYQWSDCTSHTGSCSNVAGGALGRSSSYVLQSTDVGKWIRVSVTATNSDGQRTANSAISTAAVTAGASGPPAPVSPPVLTAMT